MSSTKETGRTLRKVMEKTRITSLEAAEITKTIHEEATIGEEVVAVETTGIGRTNLHPMLEASQIQRANRERINPE
jgi:activator of 2-hydroxyglutaryl-CoA dehydratase